jgi:hypothetical protein
MKKTTKTTKAKTPAPAKKAATAKPKAVKKTVVKKAPAKPDSKADKKKSTAPKTITISAKVDVGFGNTLYLRGEGKDLSWDQGLPMVCVADDEWSLTISKSSKPRIFKFLVNDEQWNLGEDYSLRANQAGSFKPSF